MSARGRKAGQLQNARDERSWMIPRPGTLRRAVYDLLISGHDKPAICAALGIGPTAFYAHTASIVRWEKVNAWRRVALLEMRAS